MDHCFMYTSRDDETSPTFCYFCDPVARDAIVSCVNIIGMFGMVA